jgi:hypothetical protein
MSLTKCPLECGIIIFAVILVTVINFASQFSGFAYVIVGTLGIMLICCCCSHVRVSSG